MSASGYRSSEFDVLVIGAGQGGAIMSAQLAEVGLRVVCLEQGDWVQPAEYPHYEDEWEIEKIRRWSFDPNVRKLPEDYPVTGETLPFMFSGVGGSTLHYLGGWPRYRPSDFRKGTEHGLEQTIDWPISYEELAPWYEMGDRLVGVSGFAGDPANPPREPRPGGEAIAAGKIGLRAAAGFQRLGWHWWPGDNAILTDARARRLACNACGSCIGCPRGSLGSADVTFWPSALARGVELRTGARVSRITIGKDGRADGAEYVDVASGSEHAVVAKMVVLCANGIGSPRLLLLSAQEGHPDGLANGGGMVGKNLLHHTYGYVDAFFDEPTEGYKGGFGFTVASQEFYETSLDRGFVNGFQLFGARSSGAASAASGNLSLQALPWGSDHRPAFDRRFGRHMALAIQGEDIPRADNRVTLDPTVKDSSGLAAPHVEYKLGPNDRALTEFGLDRAMELGEAMGATEVNRVGVAEIPPAWHLLGTCRMGNSPEDSVVNRWHQTWEVPNLLVVDGSALPTAGAVNPTSTITATALRCGAYVQRNFAEIVGQKKTPANSEVPTL